jgi:fibronectin type 3 domain-containing protein
MDFPPYEIPSAPNDWIGRSQYSADPYLNGKIDDFRIYRGALPAGQVYTLATGNAAPAVPAAPAAVAAHAVPGDTINLGWSAVTGATSYSIYRAASSTGPFLPIATLVTGTSYSDTGLSVDLANGTPYYYRVAAANAGGEGAAAPASATALPAFPSLPTALVAKALSSSSISLNWTPGSNDASFTIRRSTTSGGAYTVIASRVTTTSFTDTGRTAGVTYYYVISGVNAAGESANSNESSAAPTDLLVRLRFDETSGATAADSSGNGWNGTLVNSPTWTSSGKLNSALSLASASSQYVTLPTGIVAGQTAITLSAWVYLNSNSTWARIFDFGTGTSNYMFLAPVGGSNVVRFAITTAGGNNEQQINGTAPLPTGTWTHVAVVLNGSVGTLYVNGIQVGRNSSMTLNPGSLGTTTLNYIGKSQFNDPYLNGRVDDFRIYSRALSSSEISTLASSQVPPAPTGLVAAPHDGQISLKWNSVTNATSYDIKRSSISEGPYTMVATNITTTNWTDTNVTDGSQYFYVVDASNLVDTGPDSSEVGATPEPLAGDANHDGVVNTADFQILVANFNNTGIAWEQGDFTGDGVVNALDFNVLASNYGNSASTSVAPLSVAESAPPQLFSSSVFLLSQNDKNQTPNDLDVLEN